MAEAKLTNRETIAPEAHDPVTGHLVWLGPEMSRKPCAFCRWKTNLSHHVCKINQPITIYKQLFTGGWYLPQIFSRLLSSFTQSKDLPWREQWGLFDSKAKSICMTKKWLHSEAEWKVSDGTLRRVCVASMWFFNLTELMKWVVAYQDWVSLAIPEVSLIYHYYISVHNPFKW